MNEQQILQLMVEAGPNAQDVLDSVSTPVPQEERPKITIIGDHNSQSIGSLLDAVDAVMVPEEMLETIVIEAPPRLDTRRMFVEKKPRRRGQRRHQNRGAY